MDYQTGGELMTKLNVGCGHDIKEGHINIDYCPGPGVDMVADITRPLPYPDSSVDEIYCAHTLEHIQRWEDVVIEFYRILRPGGKLIIRVPITPNYYTGHVRQFAPCTMDGFIIENRGKLVRGLDTPAMFHLNERRFKRQLRFKWHLQHHLGIDTALIDRIGKRYEIIWDLEAMK
jgi:SAM-dependent methyltransferase